MPNQYFPLMYHPHRMQCTCLPLFLLLVLAAGVFCGAPIAVAQQREHFRQEYNGLKYDVDPYLEGNCREGDCMNGRGVVQLEDGALFIGEFRNGLKDGVAVRIGPNGDRYHQVWSKGELKYNKRMNALREQAMQEKYGETRGGRRDTNRKRQTDRSPGIY
ncbi:hypothetical protein [Megalodesulfovibrio paquesii]